MKAVTKLICPECRHENEPERVYCHSCGARLDRSAVAQIKKKEDPKAARQHMQGVLSARRARLRAAGATLAKIVVGAFAVALLVQMLRPAEMPAAAKSDALAPQINLDLENMAMEKTIPSLRYTDQQVNAYLVYAVKPKRGAASDYLHLERVVVGFEDGKARLTGMRTLFGFPITTAALAQVQIENGKIVYQPRGEWVGRMPIHPLLIPYTRLLFADVDVALQREQKSLAKQGGLEFQPGAVVITPRRPTL